MLGLHSKNLVSVQDYQRQARRVLPRMLADFVDGGALSESTLARNRTGFQDIQLRSRAFRSTDAPDTRCVLFGEPLAVPLLIAPTGASGLLWPRGEVAAAQAAAQAGLVMQVSAGSILTLETIAAASSSPKWLQIFLYKDRDLTLEFLARAKAAGYKALIVTTDAPVHGIREKDRRNNFTITRKPGLRNFLDAALHWRWAVRMLGQLDGAPGTIDALPGVCDAAAGRVPVILDGGVTRGTDILKALTIGASACAIGRAHLWGMAVAGQAGVAEIISILSEELRNAMIIGGWKSVTDLSREDVAMSV